MYNIVKDTIWYEFHINKKNIYIDLIILHLKISCIKKQMYIAFLTVKDSFYINQNLLEQ